LPSSKAAFKLGSNISMLHKSHYCNFESGIFFEIIKSSAIVFAPSSTAGPLII